MTYWTDSLDSFIPVSDSASRQIVRRHLNAYTVTNEDAYAVLAHLPRNCRQYDVLGVVELDFKKSVGLLVDNGALRRNQIVSSQ
jgi:hypothetical protein